MRKDGKISFLKDGETTTKSTKLHQSGVNASAQICEKLSGIYKGDPDTEKSPMNAKMGATQYDVVSKN